MAGKSNQAQVSTEALYEQAEAAQGTGAPVSEASGNAEPSQPNQAQPEPYLTPSQLQEALGQFANQFGRQIQSQLDKRQSRIDQKLAQLQGRNKQVLDEARAAKLPDDQIKQLEAHLAQDTQRRVFMPEAPNEAPGGPEAPEGQAPQAQPADEVSVQAQQLWADLSQEFGVVLNEGDPEMQLIQANGTPAQFLASINRAYMAKFKRQAQKPAAAPAARAPGVAPSGGIARTNRLDKIKPTDAESLYEVAEQDFARATRR